LWKRKQTRKRLTLFGAGSGIKKYSTASTSLMTSMGSIISVHNKRVLSGTQRAIANATTSSAPPCTNRKRRVCLLNGDCRKKSVVYQTTVHVPNMTIRTYIGLCETEFKTRWYNHTQLFRIKQLSNATELAKYIWLCKDRRSTPEIK